MSLERLILLIIVGCASQHLPSRIQTYSFVFLPFVTMWFGVPTEIVLDLSNEVVSVDFYAESGSIQTVAKEVCDASTWVRKPEYLINLNKGTNILSVYLAPDKLDAGLFKVFVDGHECFWNADTRLFELDLNNVSDDVTPVRDNTTGHIGVSISTNGAVLRHVKYI